MNSAEYITVLKNRLLPFKRRFRRIPITYPQDNATIHTSAETRAWFGRHNIDLMHWTSCSPDCNPVENTWGILVKKVYANNKQYGTIQELKTAILRAWEETDHEMVMHLVGTMPHRIFDLIRNNDGLISY